MIRRLFPLYVATTCTAGFIEGARSVYLESKNRTVYDMDFVTKSLVTVVATTSFAPCDILLGIKDGLVNKFVEAVESSNNKK